MNVVASAARWGTATNALVVVRCALGLIATLMPTLAPSAAARTQMSVGIAANYNTTVTSWSEIPFRTIVRQRYDFSCGSAAVATLLSFHYDRMTAEQPVFNAMWAVGDQATIRKSGFSMLDIKRYLDGIGFVTEGFRLPFDKLVTMERPGIVLLDLAGYKHFVVLKGIAGGSVLVGDPMLGLTHYRASDFMSHWNGIFLTIVRNPGSRAPRYNLATEWPSWSATAFDGGRSAAPITNITDYLPPIYQITSVTLSGVTAATGR